LTIDGYESHFQVNYLSHFLLTLILIPALAKGGGTEGSKLSRIVNVSSIVSRIGKIDFEDLLMK
jgi:retinol dehydrogenase-12